MAKFIKTDGTIKEVIPKDRKEFSLKELQKFVGGLIQMVSLPSGKEIIVNDEGKLIGLPKNEEATKIWKEEYPIKKYPDNNDELVVGDILLVERLSEIGLD